MTRPYIILPISFNHGVSMHDISASTVCDQCNLMDSRLLNKFYPKSQHFSEMIRAGMSVSHRIFCLQRCRPLESVVVFSRSALEMSMLFKSAILTNVKNVKKIGR